MNSPNQLINHSAVVGVAMRNAYPLIKTLRLHEVIAGERPAVTGSDVAAAAASLFADDPSIGSQVQQLATIATTLRRNFTNLPKGQKLTLFAIARDLRETSEFEALDDTLTRLAQLHGDAAPGLLEGFRIAATILTEGRASIYDPADSYHDMVGAGSPVAAKDSVKSVGSTDAGGAVAGAVSGAAGLGPGVVTGAIAGAAVASMTQVVVNVVDEVLGTDDVELFEDIKDKFPVPA